MTRKEMQLHASSRTNQCTSERNVVSFYTGLQPKHRFGSDSNFVAINDTSLNTNCFDEVLVEAWSEIHTPVFVIMDSKEGLCLKAASLSKFCNCI